MLVELKSLRPFSLRDFKVDPIDDEHVAELTRSIEEFGFWGGIVCRQNNGQIEIVDGHVRVKAAIAAGIVEADVFVADQMDDERAVIIYGRANIPRESEIWLYGVVAQAIRLLAQRNRPAVEILAAQDKKTPWQKRRAARLPILELLKDTPGITDRRVQSLMEDLKAGGIIDRIVAEVAAAAARPKE